MPVATSLLLAAAVSSCAAKSANVERHKDLGGGFCVVTLAVSVQGGFEAVGHFQHCFHGERDFGQCEGMSVSPSRKMAVWQDNNGAVQFFRVGSPKQVQLLSDFAVSSYLDKVKWDESAGTVQVKGSRDPKEYTLSIPAAR